MRLDKLLANTGFGSRKDVKEKIRKSHVTVNDKIIKSSKHKIDLDKDIVLVDNMRVDYREFIYIMLNKPAGYISATEDKREKTVIDLLEDSIKYFEPFPVGRLDKDTEGLLLLTNDGELAHQLTSPKKEIEKTYYAIIDGIVTEEDIVAFKKGVTLKEGYFTKPATLEILVSDKKSEIELTITEGKYHQVKRMFASQGKKVKFLKRIRMGNLLLDPSLKKGSYRELTEVELTNYNKLDEG